MALAPYVDMASIVVATHKKMKPVGKFNVTDVCSRYIYPNTEGNIGV